MTTYVNHHAMREVFEPLESQPDPVRRAEQLREIQGDFAERIIQSYERTAFELKERGWLFEQIAHELDTTVALAKSLVSDYAKRTNRIPPQRNRKGYGTVVDIRSIVRRSDGRRRK